MPGSHGPSISESLSSSGTHVASKRCSQGVGCCSFAGSVSFGLKHCNRFCFVWGCGVGYSGRGTANYISIDLFRYLNVTKHIYSICTVRSFRSVERDHSGRGCQWSFVLVEVQCAIQKLKLQWWGGGMGQ